MGRRLRDEMRKFQDEFWNLFRPKSNEFRVQVLDLVKTKRSKENDQIDAILQLKKMCLKNAEVTMSVRDFLNSYDYELFKCPLCQSDYKEAWHNDWAWDASVCDQITKELDLVPSVDALDKNMPYDKFQEQECKINQLRRDVFEKYRKYYIKPNHYGFTKPWGLEGHFNSDRTPTNFCRPFFLFEDIIATNNPKRLKTLEENKLKESYYNQSLVVGL